MTDCGVTEVDGGNIGLSLGLGKNLNIDGNLGVEDADGPGSFGS